MAQEQKCIEYKDRSVFNAASNDSERQNRALACGIALHAAGRHAEGA